MSMNLLDGRTAFVTGGTGGIGAAICRALAAAGANVAVGYNSSQTAAVQLVSEMAAVPRGHAAFSAPVTNSAALRDCAARITSKYGQCDILVNCAGTTRFVEHADLDALDDDLIDEIFRTNVRGALACTRAFLPALRQSDSAVVINISSVAGVTANGSNVAYCASKAALDNITRSLARALAPEVRVLSVSPGLVDTEFVRGLDAGWRAEQVSRTPLQRLAAPEDVASAVLVAASHMKFTTGAVLTVDGGRPLA